MELLTLDKFPQEVLAGIDVQRAFIASRLIVAAERLGVFRELHGKRMNAAAIGRALKIHKVYRDTFLNSLVGLGLLQKKEDVYWNSPFAEKYFIEERSIYWTRQYSKECVQAYERLTLLEEMLASGRSYTSLKGLKPPSYTEAMKRDPRQAEDFTQMLFHFHQGDAEALANHLDLSKHRAVLDLGGGSGVMSIALAKKNPHLRASILDLAVVCKIADGNIKRAGLSSRVTTMAGDITHKLPAGYDVIMFCDIGPLPKQLLRNACRSLPEGGLVVAVDRYLSEDRTSPLDRVMAPLAGSGFPRETTAEMVAELKSCGFRKVTARNIYKDLWCLTGTKAADLSKSAKTRESANRPFTAKGQPIAVKTVPRV